MELIFKYNKQRRKQVHDKVVAQLSFIKSNAIVSFQLTRITDAILTYKSKPDLKRLYELEYKLNELIKNIRK